MSKEFYFVDGPQILLQKSRKELLLLWSEVLTFKVLKIKVRTRNQNLNSWMNSRKKFN